MCNGTIIFGAIDATFTNSHRPQVIIFDYEIPINKTITIKILAEKGQTSMYVDGELIGQENLQMLCPLEMLGSEKENVFRGIVKFIQANEIIEF